MTDSLSSPERNDSCWCGSGQKYKRCHGLDRSYPRGAAVPTDPPPDGGIWIAPDVVLSPDAVTDLVDSMCGAPIHMPPREATQRPLFVNAFSERLAAVAIEDPPFSMKAIGMERADAFDGLGLGSDDEKRLVERLTSITPNDFDALVAAVFRAGKATLDRLRRDAASPTPPTALWAAAGDASRLIGQTLLWADHYIVTDAVAEHLLRHPEREQLWRAADAFAREMRLRPLLEHGSVALVPEEVVKVLAAEPAYGATDAALTSGALINWVKSQLRVGGPTDREVIFVDTRDASDLGEMFLYARVVEPPNEHGTFRTEALSHRYDPDHDYQPWIDQTRGQVAARHIQTANFNLAVAGLLGGQFIATSLFDARLLARLGSAPATPHSLIWADVPSLPQAEPATLAKIAAEDKTVEALRRTVRRGMRAAGDPSVNATEIADQLREDARLLERAIQRDRIWKLAVPAALGVSGLGLGVVAGGALGAASAVLGTAGGLSPLLGDRDSRRENAAYAVYIANRARRGKR